VTGLLRDRPGDQRVTQLSHHLLGNPTVGGALQTLLLLAAVWLAWSWRSACCSSR